MSSKFIHLHAHSEYSLDIGFFTISDYVRFCYDNKFESAVITERFNLYSAIKFYKECLDFNIKPIIGCELFLEYDSQEKSKVIILCKNKTGYLNLSKLISQAYTNNMIDGLPILKYKWFLKLYEGLIIISPSFESDVGLSLINKNIKRAQEEISFWKKLFKNNYFLGLSNLAIPIENIFLDRVFNFINIKEIMLTAINEICFLRKKDFLSYKSKITIFDQNKRQIRDITEAFYQNRYFKTEIEMLQSFKKMETALYNTLEISKLCNFIFDTSKDYSPKYIGDKTISNAELLLKTTTEILVKRLKNINYKLWKIYISRLKKEVKIINKVGFENYFLITHDFITWAKKKDIYAGPGRGSCSGSLTAYFLNITQIDPIQYNLLFERFLNKERLSKPDFDIDFCIESRDLVIDYIYEKYDFENVAQIITFGCMTIKAVIRDIGRILGYSYVFVDRIIKLISNEFGISLKSELIHNPNIKNEYNQSYDIQKILNLSLKIEGIIKNVGKHAGGLVIAPVKIEDHIPLAMDENNPMTQFDKYDSDSIGFVKFDFLGLKNLSIITDVLDTISSYLKIFCNKTIYIQEIMSYSQRTYKLLQNGDTTGIFQLESNGIKSVLQKLKPSSFLDISALIALYRPGPLQSGMLSSFIKRRLGIEQINYIHPILKKVLDETHGMIVYQEQVMLIAQMFSGYDLSMADSLRAAMSKKKKEEMTTHLNKFAYGAAKHNIDRATSENVFYLVEKFAGYGFNKAHSIGYSYLTYNLAWLKSNFNIIFLASLISSDMYNNNNLETFIKDAIHFNIKILPPDINRSFYNFTIVNKYCIRYGLGAIKNVGSTIIVDIIANRCTFGSFESFFDFLNRIDIENLSKKILQNLIYSGVFDMLNCFKFKLILITAKVFDLYFKPEKKKLYKNHITIDDFFKNKIKKKSQLIKYKQTENAEIAKLFPYSYSKTNLILYKHESYIINTLSFSSGNYLNLFILGYVKNISIKNHINEKLVIITVLDIKNRVYTITTSYERYNFTKNIIAHNKILVFCCYKYNNTLKELFIEDFYKFRCNFIKKIKINLTCNLINETFIKNFFKNITPKLIKGKTKLHLIIKNKNKKKTINYKPVIECLIHDDFLNFIMKFKEVKNIELIYKF